MVESASFETLVFHQQAFYHTISVISEGFDLFFDYEGMQPFVYALAPVVREIRTLHAEAPPPKFSPTLSIAQVDGLAVVAFTLFFVLSVLTDTVLPHWREQWSVQQSPGPL